MPDFNKMVVDMMADLRAENARLVLALRQKEEEIRRSEEAQTRLAADLNDLRAKVRTLAADYTDPMGDPMYVAQPRTYRWLTCPETDFYDLYADYPEDYYWPLIPVCFVGCGRTYVEARGAYERAR